MKANVTNSTHESSHTENRKKKEKQKIHTTTAVKWGTHAKTLSSFLFSSIFVSPPVDESRSRCTFTRCGTATWELESFHTHQLDWELGELRRHTREGTVTGSLDAFLPLYMSNQTSVTSRLLLLNGNERTNQPHITGIVIFLFLFKYEPTKTSPSKTEL